MKISIDSVTSKYRNATKMETKNKNSVPFMDTGKNFDQIMIQCNSKENVENRIAEAAENTLQHSVFQKTSDEKIASLKEQVSQGTYRTDAEALASRILFMKGER